jgi:hypothetical protein
VLETFQQKAAVMVSRDENNTEFSWSDVIAGVLAIGLTVLASPAPARSAEADGPSQIADDDWNFLWIAPAPASHAPYIEATDIPNPFRLPLSAGLMDAPAAADSFELPALQRTDTFNRRIERLPVGIRFAPPVSGADGAIPSVTMREDYWTMMSIDGVMRISAHARGPLEAEDTAQVQSPATFPRGLGTGFSFVTQTPVYLGASMKTNRAIYDIDMERFRGARWSTSVFMGTDTSLGPLYLGTTQEPGGGRSTYLYLGRWF